MLLVLFKKNYSKYLTKQEDKILKSLKGNRYEEFKFSRSCARLALSNLLNICPLKIPLIAKFGEAPYLENDLGNISFSHCEEAFVIVWSNKNIGIDIESKKRKIKNTEILSKIILPNQINDFNSFKENRSNINFLSNWVILESAIKSTKGKLFRDFKSWQIENNLRYAWNKKLNLKVNTQLISYKDFLIGISSLENNKLGQLIICEN